MTKQNHKLGTPLWTIATLLYLKAADEGTIALIGVWDHQFKVLNPDDDVLNPDDDVLNRDNDVLNRDNDVLNPDDDVLNLDDDV